MGWKHRRRRERRAGRPAGGGISHPATALAVIYRRLFRAFGPQGWWPATSPFEMMLGAILTQATNWHNVEQAIARLRRALDRSEPGRAVPLAPRRMLALGCRPLERAIRPAGYFRQKAKRLTVFSRWYLSRFAGSPRRMFRVPWPALRQELLALHGIGPETADSMLCYAGGQPVFVVDAYTTRVFRRHRLIGADATYHQVQQLVMQHMRSSATPDGPSGRYNEFHALLVAVGKRYCHRRNPDCRRCPLGDLPHTSR